MDNNRNDQQFADYTVVGSGTNTASKTFMANVFAWMFLALGISALFAFMFASNAYLMQYLLSNRALFYAVMFSPLAFVLLMSYGFNKLSFPALIAVFLAYSAVTGISLSFILLIYTKSSVIGCFAAGSVMFGVMAVMGYTTKQDLTSFGRILQMGLIGIVVAMVINMFIGSGPLSYIISFIGIMVFTGLTAYDVQTLKRIGEGIEYEGISAADVKKSSVMGALRLYLDFINLFLMLLRFFGGRRD